MGERIRARRGTRTLQEIASSAGISPSHIQYYEEGRIPRGDILEKLATVLGASSRYLLTGEGGHIYKVAEAPEDYGDPHRMRLVKAIKRFALTADEDLIKALLESLKAFEELMERREKSKEG